MTKFSQDLLKQKLAQCADTFAHLKQVQAKGTLEEFRRDTTLYHAVCFRFITVIENLFDAGQIVLASKSRHATGEESIAVLLGREKIISADLTERFASMYGFRNRLVHAYGTLSDEKVADYLATRLGDIEELLTVFKTFSQKQQ